jgi:hypothetical protein
MLCVVQCSIASRGQREFVVVKRPPASESDEKDTVQQQLSAHAEWMQTLDSHESSVMDSPPSELTPTHQAASLRLKMPRKRRQRTQSKSVHHDSAMDASLDQNDSKFRPQLSTISALPHLWPTNALTAPLSSDPPAANESSPSRDVQENPPKLRMGEIRRSLRFKSNEATPSSTPPPSARELESKIEPTRSQGKTSYTRRPKSTTTYGEEEPEQLGLDGRFDNSATDFAAPRAIRKRKWHLSKRLSAARSTDNNRDGTRPITEDALGRRVASSRVERDDQIDEKRHHLTPRRAEPLSCSIQVLQTTSGAPMRPISSSRSKGPTGGLGQPQSGLTVPPSGSQPATTERRAGSLRETRPLRQLQAKTAAPSGSSGAGSSASPPPIELIPLSPAVANDPTRSAAFNRLLQQYLGLLQCSPTRPHHVTDSSPEPLAHFNF